MSKSENSLLEQLRIALSKRNRKGSRLAALPALLSWFQKKSGGQRAILVSMKEDSSYRIWSSCDSEGRKIHKAAEVISHHAFEHGSREEGQVLFSDVHLDRRFRTPSEADGVARTRWIQTFRLSVRGESSVLYIDSKFGSPADSLDNDDEIELVRSVIETIIDLELSLEGLPLARDAEIPAVTSPAPVDPVSEIPVKRIRRHLGEFSSYSPLLSQNLVELQKIVKTDISVLIEGESGTGKELLARSIHEASGCDGPLVALHCSSITESLIEIELFGNEKGAFTDADKERPGLIETAAGGTLLLDGIDEGSQALQTSLLRFLESGVYRRVAGEEERVADVRIIACSAGRNGGGDIRQDLYYRLAGYRVWLPPLRERPEDALLIVESGLSETESELPVLEAEAQAILMSHSWPGNGWEAIHLARRILASGHLRVDGSMVLELLDGSATSSAEQTSIDPGVREVLGLAEREVILRALEGAEGNKTIACRNLGISRRTLYRRMQKHNIPLKDRPREDS
ncbi:MAG: sigma 54-interacting transcriptional regulator [Planctomycetota bacterium]